MKNTKQRVALAGLVALLVVGGWLGLRERPKTTGTSASASTPASGSPQQPVALDQPVPKPKLFKATGYPPKTADERAMWGWWNYMRKTDPDFEWKTPIEFYGKVIDQNNAPVEGARVDLSWSSIEGQPNQRTLTTGVDGRFRLAGAEGKGLTVSVFKERHVGGAEARKSFEYAAFFEPHFHVPDPNAPVIFRLWKLGNAEPMYLWTIANDLTVDGMPHSFSIRNGQIGGNDISLAVKRTNETAPGHFDYTLTVQAGNGGGLAVTQDEHMFTAPAEGYVPSITVAQKYGPPDYQGAQNLRFYLKTPDNKYAAITAEVQQHQGPSAQVQMVIYFNPSGSRNLEYDYKLRLKR